MSITNEIVVMKAERLAKSDPPAARIEIRGKVPRTDSLEEIGRFFEKDAELIAGILIESLPQGTYDRLLALMMRKAAEKCYFIGKK